MVAFEKRDWRKQIRHESGKTIRRLQWFLTIPTVCGESFKGKHGCAEGFFSGAMAARSVALTNHSQSMIVVETEGFLLVCQEFRGRNISLGMLNDPDPFIIHGKIRISTAFCPMSYLSRV